MRICTATSFVAVLMMLDTFLFNASISSMGVLEKKETSPFVVMNNWALD
jgi:hypothetical protein